MADERQIAFRPAVEISYLSEEKQHMLYDNMQIQACTPSLAQMIKMKRMQQEGRLTDDVIHTILTEEKPSQKEQIRIPRERIEEYFTPDTPEKKMEEDIIEGLKLLREKERGKVQQRKDIER